MVSSTPKDFQKAHEKEKFDAYVNTVTFGQRVPKSNCLGTYLQFEKSILDWFGQPGSTLKKKFGPIMSNF